MAELIHSQHLTTYVDTDAFLYKNLEQVLKNFPIDNDLRTRAIGLCKDSYDGNHGSYRLLVTKEVSTRWGFFWRQKLRYALHLWFMKGDGQKFYAFIHSCENVDVTINLEALIEAGLKKSPFYGVFANLAYDGMIGAAYKYVVDGQVREHREESGYDPRKPDDA